MTTVASRLIETLRMVGGVNTLYIVPGASLNPLLDALYSQGNISKTDNMHEGAAAHAALATGMYSGLGVAVSSQGAGFSELNKLAWLADANASPTLLLVGQSSQEKAGKEHAFQAIDASITSGYAKEVIKLKHGDNTSKVVSDAIIKATSGAPGAVIIEMPVDVLGAQDVSNYFSSGKRKPVLPNKKDKESIAKIVEYLNEQTRRPLFVLGDIFRAEAIRSPKIQQTLDSLCKKVGAAVGTTHGASDQWPTESELSVGNFGYNLLSSQVDVFSQFNYPILLGAKPDDNLTVRSVGSEWTRHPFVMIYPDKEVLKHYQKLYPTMIAIYSDVMPTLEVLSQFDFKDASNRFKHITRAHTQMLSGMKDSSFSNGPNMAHVASSVIEATKGENIIHVFDAGDAASDIKQRIPYKGKDHIATASGHVGFALPGGIGIANAAKNQISPPVVVIHTGDSGMHYAPAELAMAVKNKLPVLVLAYNDSGYWAVNRCMRRDGFAGTADSVADLPTVSFAKVAEAYGAKGVNVFDVSALSDTLKEAIKHAKSGVPTVVDVPISRERVTQHKL